MRQHRRTSTESAPGSPADCLDEAIILELPAGIAPAGLMGEHGEHIANCDRCALLLKTYLFEFSDEMTPEEETTLSELKSSKPDGQKKILDTILRHMIQHRGG